MANGVAVKTRKCDLPATSPPSEARHMALLSSLLLLLLRRRLFFPSSLSLSHNFNNNINKTPPGRRRLFPHPRGFLTLFLGRLFPGLAQESTQGSGRRHYDDGDDEDAKGKPATSVVFLALLVAVLDLRRRLLAHPHTLLRRRRREHRYRRGGDDARGRGRSRLGERKGRCHRRQHSFCCCSCCCF